MTHNELNDDSYDSGIGEKYWHHVLEQVANGMAWEAIIEEWRGALSKEAIAEAVVPTLLKDINCRQSAVIHLMGALQVNQVR